MTVQEAIKDLSKNLKIINEVIAKFKRFENENKEELNDRIIRKESLETAIEALKEVQKYHEIGTVEECQEAINSVYKPYRSEKYYDTEPEYDPCKGCTVEGTNNEDFYWPGQGPCDHCGRR